MGPLSYRKGRLRPREVKDDEKPHHVGRSTNRAQLWFTAGCGPEERVGNGAKRKCMLGARVPEEVEASLEWAPEPWGKPVLSWSLEPLS